MRRMQLHEILGMNEYAQGPGAATRRGRVASIVDLLEAQADYRLFVMGLKDTDLDGRLRCTGPYTVFAPTDGAFRIMPDLAALFKATDLLRSILLRHLVWGFLDTGALGDIEYLAPIYGAKLNISKNALRIEDGEVVQPNMQAPNGMVHGVNRLFNSDVPR